MKSYQIRIEDGHHVVDMKPKKESGNVFDALQESLDDWGNAWRNFFDSLTPTKGGDKDENE